MTLNMNTVTNRNIPDGLDLLFAISSMLMAVRVKFLCVTLQVFK